MSRILLCLALLFETVLTMKVTLSKVGPVVRGSNVTFTATVTDYDDSPIEFSFWDNAQPQHSVKQTLSSNVSTWIVAYPRDLYEAGEYTITVEIKKSYFGIYILEASDSITFKLTDSLNGNLVLFQNNTKRPNSFVSVNKTVTHYIQLPDNEMQFLVKNSSQIVTYWFIDCGIYDKTTDFAFNYTYSDAMKSHSIDALVVANHEPLPPLPTTTTSSTTTTSTTTPKPATTTASSNITTTASSNITTTTLSPNASNSTSDDKGPAHKIAKRALSNKTKGKGSTVPEAFICKNTNVPIGDTYTYGHYRLDIGVREPIATVNITGLNWLQHGDLLNLQVKFAGSPPFDYCAEYKPGQYNITGNETCKFKTRTVSNLFPLVHYFSDSDQHTVVVVIENDIGKVVSRATINIYKASVHAQLSVIVVPVVSCLLAVILVVFGIAYYQHRSRYNIEVADFDFGQQLHFDYKTFTERLRDSFRNAFHFGRQEDTDPLTANTRYDSMT